MAALDYVQLASSLSLRIVVRLGSSAAYVFDLCRFGSTFAILDVGQLRGQLILVKLCSENLGATVCL